MTSVTTIIKYALAASSGVAGQQPYKAKAKFDKIKNWKYIDKLNELKMVEFSVPNDEFHRANAVVERTGFVPFVKPFRGLVTGKSANETEIKLIIKEFATHLERRIFKHDDEKRIKFTDEKWFDSEWKYRRMIRVPKADVIDDIKNPVILINVAANTGFKNQALSTGNDFVVTTKDGVTKIPHDIEKYDTATGELVLWCKPTKISDSSATDLFIYYGNPLATNQEDIINVWKDTYKVESGTNITFFPYDACGIYIMIV